MGDGSFNLEAKKVAIIDERSEIAASVNGIPQHDVGLRTDVMDACPKTAGLMMMIRSMSPDVIIVDEIGKKADVEALIDALFAGVNIICTLHGSHLSEVQNRPSLHMLFAGNVFDRFIVLERRTQAQFLMTVLDQNETVLYETRCHVL